MRAEEQLEAAQEEYEAERNALREAAEIALSYDLAPFECGIVRKALGYE